MRRKQEEHWNNINKVFHFQTSLKSFEIRFRSFFRTEAIELTSSCHQLMLLALQALFGRKLTSKQNATVEIGTRWDQNLQSHSQFGQFVNLYPMQCNLLAISLRSKVNRKHQRLNGAMREWSVPQFHEGVSDPPPLFLPVWSLTPFASNGVTWKSWKCAKVLC